jgi:hypothetical protein
MQVHVEVIVGTLHFELDVLYYFHIEELRLSILVDLTNPRAIETEAIAIGSQQ